MRALKTAVLTLLSHRRDVVTRFPIVAILAVAVAVLANLDIAEAVSLSDDQRMDIYSGGALAMLAALAAHLWAESWERTRPLNIAVAILAAAVMGAWTVLQGNVDLNVLFMLAGMVLVVMSAAHLRRGVDASSYWYFNYRLGLAALMGIAAILVLCGGLSLVVSSLEFLFDISLGSHPHGHIWATGVALVGPLFLLALVPSDLDEPFTLSEAPGLLERAISVLVNYALIPLILVYAVILHLYAVRIAVTGVLPTGEIGWLVLAFGAVGTASYLIAHPWRESGSLAVRWFLRSWFWLMIVPVALLVLAVWLRVAQYGITMERYGLMLFALWMVGMAVYLALGRGVGGIRIIPASLAVLLLLASFGPWGAVAVSTRSQMAEFERLLQRNNVLADGRVRAGIDADTMPADAVSRANSILSTLRELRALDRLAPWFAGSEQNPFATAQDDHERLFAIRTALGFDTSGSRPLPEGRWVGYQADAAATETLAGYDTLSGPHRLNTSPDRVQSRQSSDDQPDETSGPAIEWEDDTLTVTPAGGGARFTFDLTQTLRGLAADGDDRTHGNGPPLVVTARSGAARAALVITQINGQANDKDAVVRNAEFWLLWSSGR